MHVTQDMLIYRPQEFWPNLACLACQSKNGAAMGFDTRNLTRENRAFDTRKTNIGPFL